MAVSERMVPQFSLSLAKVHPLAIFNICDCYVPHPDQTEHGLSTLLGLVLPNSTVDIRNYYVVPHSENLEQVALDRDYHHNMLISQQKEQTKDLIDFHIEQEGGTGIARLLMAYYKLMEERGTVHRKD